MTQGSPSGFAIPVIGLTGGVASGKSTVARLIQTKLATPVIDADQIARELSSPGGRAAGAIQARFGTLERAELRAKVFADPEARRELEAILHPLIAQESRARVAELAAQGAVRVVYEAALLVETGRYQEMDGLVVVQAPLEQRIARLMERDGIGRAQAEAVIRAQATDEARAAVAGHLIKNAGSLEDLEAEVERLGGSKLWQKRK